jgi:hypothetical protein
LNVALILRIRRCSEKCQAGNSDRKTDVVMKLGTERVTSHDFIHHRGREPDHGSPTIHAFRDGEIIVWAIHGFQWGY